MFVFYSVFKVWTARNRYALFDVLHVISTQESLPGCSSHAKHVFIKNVWQPPALPCRLQHSTIGRTDLHRRVRDGNGCCLRTHRHQTNLSMLYFQSIRKTTRCFALTSSRIAAAIRIPLRLRAAICSCLYARQGLTYARAGTASTRLFLAVFLI